MSTDITASEIATIIKRLKAASKAGDRYLFDNNSAYLRSAVEALIVQYGETLQTPAMPLYTVKLYSKITQTEAWFDVRATTGVAAVRALFNRGFDSKNHIVRSVDLVRA